MAPQPPFISSVPWPGSIDDAPGWPAALPFGIRHACHCGSLEAEMPR